MLSKPAKSPKSAKGPKLEPGFIPSSDLDALVHEMHVATAGSDKQGAFVPHRGLLAHLGVRHRLAKLPEFVLLIDKAEKGTGAAPYLQYDELCKAMRIRNVPAFGIHLESADYAIARILHDTEFGAAGGEGSDSDDADLSDMSDHERGECLRKRHHQLQDGELYPLLEIIARIERKTGADLASSITGTKKDPTTGAKVKVARRNEQRAKLVMGPPGPAVWLYVENGYDGYMMKANRSALIHDTFSMDGMKEGVKLCVFQLKTDAEVPDFLFQAFRRSVESYEEQRSGTGGWHAQTLATLSHSINERQSDPKAAFAAGLSQMVRRLGHGHAQAIVSKYGDYYSWSERLVEAGRSAQALEALKKELTELRSTAGDKRRLGPSLAQSIIKTLMESAVERIHRDENVSAAVKRAWDAEHDDISSDDDDDTPARPVKGGERKRPTLELKTTTMPASSKRLWDEDEEDEEEEEVTSHSKEKKKEETKAEVDEVFIDI